MTLPADKFIAVPLADLAEPKGGLLRCIKDHWWIVNAEGAALFYENTNRPQCNVAKAVCEHALKKLAPEGSRLQFIPVAFVRHECES